MKVCSILKKLAEESHNLEMSKKIKKKICHECIQLIIVILLFIIIKYTQIDKDKINLNSDKYTALFAAERNVN